MNDFLLNPLSNFNASIDRRAGILPLQSRFSAEIRIVIVGFVVFDEIVDIRATSPIAIGQFRSRIVGIVAASSSVEKTAEDGFFRRPLLYDDDTSGER